MAGGGDIVRGKNRKVRSEMDNLRCRRDERDEMGIELKQNDP